MVAKFFIEEGDLKGSTFPLEEERDKWIIGSDPDECQLVLQDSSVSQQHVLISRIPEGILIENLSQTNPARINGEEMSLLPRLLEEEDTIQIGNQRLLYSSKESPSHLNQAKETDVATSESALETQTEKKRKSPLAPPSYEDLSETEEGFIEDELETPSLAKINFDLIETGRWLLKVVSGPNTGAEFYMETGRSYLLGTDPNHSDVIFHDTSVSRQHARITVTPEETLLIEDLKSRNGVLIGDVRIEGKQELPINTIVSLGTTAFAIYDREGEMHTIISPLLPSLLKSIQKEPPKEQEQEQKTEKNFQTPSSAIPSTSSIPSSPKSSFNFSSMLILFTILGLFALAGLGMFSLFVEPKPIESNQPQENINELLEQALHPFPAIRYTFNPVNKNLFLVGHLLTSGEKNLLFSRLQGLNTHIKSIDDSGLVIDEYAWREVNSILADNPAWKEISVHSPKAGQFIVSGFLKTRKQAEQLSNYLSLNFPYPELLKNHTVVEEDVITRINQSLQKQALLHVLAEIKNGEVVLTGQASENQEKEIQQAIADIKQIPGIRSVSNKIQPLTKAVQAGMENISEHYHVTGESRIGDKYTVVINGRIVSEGDSLDAMEITKITPDYILLKNAEGQYRIDY